MQLNFDKSPPPKSIRIILQYSLCTIMLIQQRYLNLNLQTDRNGIFVLIWDFRLSNSAAVKHLFYFIIYLFQL